MTLEYFAEVPNPEFRPVSILGVDEPVLGGPGGPDNRGHRELAERDAFLKLRIEAADALIAALRGDVGALQLNSGSAVATAVRLAWAYGDASPSFELWGAGFTWRDMAPVAITGTTAGDDTIDVASTDGVKAGRTYVIVDAAGNQLDTVIASVVLTGTRLRSTLNVGVSLNAQSGAFLARTAATVRDGYAVFSHGDAFYSRVIDELRVQSGGQLVLRRSATGTGAFAVSYRVAGSSAWAVAPLASTTSRAADTRDETFTIGVGGAIELRIVYTAPAGNLGATERVEHMTILPPSRADAASAVARPLNVSPADQAANVGQTPTLTGSGFLSLYGLAQAGAEFRIARNPSMSDLVFNSSTDFLAAWLNVSGQATAFMDVVATGPKAFTLVGNGVSIRTTDGGLNYTTGTVSGDLRRVAVDPAANLLVAVGANGAIRTSGDFGLNYTTRAAANSYAGVFSGAVVRGDFVVVVGDAGTIQRSINRGAIFNSVQQDAAYAGTFTDLAGDGAGKLIAVGTNGEIQTSGNDGQTFTHRNAPGGYVGTYQAVAMADDGSGFAVAVGANGAIHVSTDAGATMVAKAAAGGFTGTFYGVAIRGKRVVVMGAGGEIQTSSDRGETFVRRQAGGGATGQFNAVALDANSYGLGVGAGGLVQRTNKVDSATTTFTVPAGADLLQTNAVYWWQCRYQDAQGVFSPWSAPTAFATMAVFNYVTAPQNLAPANGDTGVSLLPTLQSGAFGYVGAADTHAKSQWQIATAASFASVFYDSGESADLLSHTVPSGSVLATQTAYFWRVRHKGATNGWGAWSEPTSFTAQARPNKPSITSPADGATGVSRQPTLTASAFSMAGGGTHSRSQWQISAVSSFASIFHDSGDSTSLTSYAPPAGTLAFNTSYFARVRYKEAGGTYSAWSNVVGFKTLATLPVTSTFNIALTDGDGTGKVVTTGVDLTGGGAILSMRRGSEDPYGGWMFSTQLGINTFGQNSQYLPTTSDVQAQQSALAIGSLTGTGFTAGPDRGLAGSSYEHLSFREAPRFFAQAKRYAGGGGVATVDFADLGAIGMVWARPIEGGDWYVWHRDIPGGANMRLSNLVRLVESTKGPNTISVDGTKVTVGPTGPGGTWLIQAFAHDPSETGQIAAFSFVGDSNNSGRIVSPWANGFQALMTAMASTEGSQWWFFDRARNPSLPSGEEFALPLGSPAGEFKVDFIKADYSYGVSAGKQQIGLMIRAPS